MKNLLSFNFSQDGLTNRMKTFTVDVDGRDVYICALICAFGPQKSDTVLFSIRYNRLNILNLSKDDARHFLNKIERGNYDL